MKLRLGIWIAAAAATLAIGAWRSDAPMAEAAYQAPAAQQPPSGGRGRGRGDTPAPARQSSEGQGPFKKLVIRSVTVIDGTGGPPMSPMDIARPGLDVRRVLDIVPFNRPPAPRHARGAGSFFSPGMKRSRRA